jgi:hypothetical protein
VERALPVDEILLLPEGFARDAVPAFVDPFIYVAGVVAPLCELLHRGAVARFGRADEVVERDVQRRPDVAESLLHLPAVRQRIEPRFDRLLVDVLRVLVIPHEEVRVHAAEALVARHHVGGDLLIGLAGVRPSVHVVDGGGQIEGHGNRLHGSRLTLAGS